MIQNHFAVSANLGEVAAKVLNDNIQGTKMFSTFYVLHWVIITLLIWIVFYKYRDTLEAEWTLSIKLPHLF